MREPSPPWYTSKLYRPISSTPHFEFPFSQLIDERSYFLGLKRFKVFNSIQYDSIFIKKVFDLNRFDFYVVFFSTKFVQKFLVTECINILTIKYFLFYFFLFKLIAVQTIITKKLHATQVTTND